jgi:hypothetical protein
MFCGISGHYVSGLLRKSDQLRSFVIDPQIEVFSVNMTHVVPTNYVKTQICLNTAEDKCSVSQLTVNSRHCKRQSDDVQCDSHLSHKHSGVKHLSLMLKKTVHNYRRLNPSKPSGHYMYHQFNNQQFCFLHTQCIYVFCVDLRTNSGYFRIQH